MANGRGSLECCYCAFFRCHNPEWRDHDATYEPGECLFHHAALPDTTAISLNRICRDFKPSELFERESTRSVEERFEWFALDLVPGVLYGFNYNQPPDIRAIERLVPGQSEL